MEEKELQEIEKDPFLKEEIEKINLPKNKCSYIKKFTIRDVVFIAIMLAAIFVSSTIMPLVSSVPIFGLSVLVIAFQTSFFTSILIYKVRKPFVFLFTFLVFALLLLPMAPIMFFNNLVIAIIVEIVTICFRGYKNKYSIITVSSLYPILSLPFNYFYYLALSGQINQDSVRRFGLTKGLKTDMLTKYLQNGVYISLVVIFTIVLSILGAILGYLVAKELHKANKIKISE